MAVGVVVPAAGRGSRFGSAGNKIWLEIEGRPIIAWTLSVLQNHERIDSIIVVAAPDELDRLSALAREFSKVSAVVAGAGTRAESVGNGLAALPAQCDIVLVHDAARPIVSADLISRVVEAIMEHGAALPGLPVTDTLKRADGEGVISETVSRDGLWAVQTPQGARTADLLDAYVKLGDHILEATDEASILEPAGYAVHIVPGDEANIKVTCPGDQERVAQILAGHSEDRNALNRYPVVRTGFGYDVHSFAEEECGRLLWLGGVHIPHTRGLAGHSDADALLHAVCDALLGAAALGDIGVLFPDTDSAHKDRASIEFVREVRRRLEAERWNIVNVDVALLAEEPKIGPFRSEIVAVIADGLSIAPTQVNIKATTSEKMGFVGRREGIACWALATISRIG